MQSGAEGHFWNMPDELSRTAEISSSSHYAAMPGGIEGLQYEEDVFRNI